MIWFFGKKNKDKKPDDALADDSLKAAEKAEKVAKRNTPPQQKVKQEVEKPVKKQAEAVKPAPETQVKTEPKPEKSAIVEKKAAPEPVIEDTPKKSWLSRLTEGLSKTSTKITENISAVLTKRKLDDDLVEELEEILIKADLGPKTATRLVAEFAKDRFGKDVTDDDVKRFLAAQIETILSPHAKPIEIDRAHKPYVVLMTGVNGAGKTTTIGKIGHALKQQGYSVMMAAGDTFRAAAMEQLTVWGERSKIPVFAKTIGADAAALAFEAYDEAKKQGVDVLLIDTAGRLQNKSNLMEELAKIVRVLKKQDETAPHASLIVLDATTGQNANSQVKIFKETVDLTGLIVTKLDGSAKGGVIVSLADEFGLPIHAIGVGESIHDLKAFEARDFALSLMGLNP